MASLSVEEGLKAPILDIKYEMSLDIKKIVRVIEILLSDQTLYQNPKLKHKVLNRE
jgi:hypothetical protein